MSEYSISGFLEALAEDELEKKIVRLFSENYSEDELLEKLLQLIGSKET